MSTLELALNMLAEASTTELTRARDPIGLEENKRTARAGGRIAGDARRSIEAQTGRPVITKDNAAKLNEVVTEMIEAVAEEERNE